MCVSPCESRLISPSFDSCVSVGTSEKNLLDEHYLDRSDLTPESVRKVLLGMLLVNAGADQESLGFIYNQVYCEYPMMKDFEKRMPLHNTTLPSRCMLNTYTRNNLTDVCSLEIEQTSSTTSLRSEMAHGRSGDPIRWNYQLLPGLLRDVGSASISATSRVRVHQSSSEPSVYTFHVISTQVSYCMFVVLSSPETIISCIAACTSKARC